MTQLMLIDAPLQSGAEWPDMVVLTAKDPGNVSEFVTTEVCQFAYYAAPGFTDFLFMFTILIVLLLGGSRLINQRTGV